MKSKHFIFREMEERIQDRLFLGKALTSRTDAGALWENYLVSERRKLLCNKGFNVSGYFWRTTQQQEIDYIEERADRLLAVEFKWNPGRRVSFPKTFTNAYPEVSTMAVTPADFDLFLTQPES